MVIIAIIGPANRGLSKLNHEKAFLTIENMITEAKYNWKDIILQSGGAAGYDHLAVDLALKYKCKLILHLPCDFTDKYEDNGSNDWRINPGKLANKYHIQFSQLLGRNTLLDIKNSNPQIFTYKGFHARNKHTAQCDILIAFSHSTGTEPTDGGTAHTWKLSKAYRLLIRFS